jgi:hypothetical protein
MLIMKRIRPAATTIDQWLGPFGWAATGDGGEGAGVIDMAPSGTSRGVKLVNYTPWEVAMA